MTKSEAEKQIAEILKQLEIDQKCVVDGLYIKLVDITAFSEPARRCAASVEIDLISLEPRLW